MSFIFEEERMMIQEEQNKKNNNNDNNEETRIQIASEKQYVVVKKHLLEGLEQGSGEGIDIEDEAKEHHGRTMTTTKTTPTTPQQTRKQEKGTKHKKLDQRFIFFNVINNIF